VSDPVTVGELLKSAAEAAGDRMAARWMCETAVGLDADEFVAAIAEPVTESMVEHLDAMMSRYLAGEPLQYVLGRWGFRSLDLAVDQRVLIPRPETESVAGVALEIATEHHRRVGSVRVADVGTGSGAIGLALAAELPIANTRVWLSDVDPDALDVARANLAGLGRRASMVRIALGSWFEAFALVDDPPGPFDVIVSNPPYVAEGCADIDASVVRWEPAHALFAGSDGLDALRVIIATAPDHVVPGGWLVLEIGADQGEAVAGLMTERGFCDTAIAADPAGRPRIATGRWPDNVSVR
jgi:release factor glutamine methyltransferase